MDMTSPMKPKPLVSATCKLGKKGCFEDGRCHALGDCENKIVTNADRIRAMSDEEMVELLKEFSAFSCIFPDKDCEEASCVECVTKWLKQPAEEEG